MNIYNLLSKEEKMLGKIVNLEKGNIIFYEHEKCNYIYFLLDGEVIISSFDIDGNEEIYNHLYKDDIFGNILAFANNNEYLGNGLAIKKSSIFVIEKEQLINILNSNKAFLLEFIKYNSNETMNSKVKAKILSKRNIKDRIIYYLTVNKGSIEISITNLAKEIMINRVCVSRVVSLLIKENVLGKKGKKLFLI